MRVRRRLVFRLATLAIGLIAARAALGAEPSAAFQSELARIFEKREYAAASFGPARWLDGGKSYTTLEASPGKDPAQSKDIVSYETASGRREVLVPASRLVPAGASKPLAIEDYAWSAGRSRLLVFTNSKKSGARTPAATTGCSSSRRARSGSSAAPRPSRRSCSRSSRRTARASRGCATTTSGSRTSQARRSHG